MSGTVPVGAQSGVAGSDQDAENDAGYREFFVRCWAPVRLAVSLRAADERFVDDAVQEAFLLARREWQRLREFDKPERWVVKVAWRQMRRTRDREQTGAVVTEAAAPDPSIAVTEHEQLRAAILRLPPRQAEAIILFTLGYSIADSAEILGVTPGTVKKHRFLARKRLRELLVGGSG